MWAKVAEQALKLAKPLGSWLDKHLKLWGAFRAGKKSTEAELKREQLRDRIEDLESEIDARETVGGSTSSERDKRLRRWANRKR